MKKNERVVLLCKHYDAVYRIILAHGVPREDREDLLHEVFIAAFKSLGKLRDVDKMGSWLWKIAENAVKRYYRNTRKKGDREVSISDEQWETVLMESAEPEEFDHIAAAIERIDRKEVLAAAVKRLDNKELSVLNLHYGLQYSLVEIAKAQRKNYSSVKSMHTRALRKLRRILEEGEV